MELWETAHGESMEITCACDAEKAVWGACER